MTTATEKEWCVRFTGSYFSLITHVAAENEEEAERTAIWQLKDHHGLDMETSGAFDIEVIETENAQ